MYISGLCGGERGKGREAFMRLASIQALHLRSMPAPGSCGSVSGDGQMRAVGDGKRRVSEQPTSPPPSPQQNNTLPSHPSTHLSLPALCITVALGQEVVEYPPFVEKIMAMLPLGSTVPVMFEQARVLWGVRSGLRVRGLYMWIVIMLAVVVVIIHALTAAATHRGTLPPLHWLTSHPLMTPRTHDSM